MFHNSNNHAFPCYVSIEIARWVRLTSRLPDVFSSSHADVICFGFVPILGILNKLFSKYKNEKSFSKILKGVPEKCLPLRRWLQLPVGTIVTVSGAASAPNLWIQPQSVTGLITRSTAGSATDVWGIQIFGWGMIINIGIVHLPVPIRNRYWTYKCCWEMF